MQTSTAAISWFRRQEQSTQVLGAPPAEIVFWALAIGLVMSTQFLSQLFIWRSYALPDILAGWASIARDRLIVSVIIGGMLVLVGRLRTRSLALRGVLLGAAIVIGAVAGELMLRWLAGGDDRQDTVSLIGRIARWSFVSVAVAGMIHLWRAGSELATTDEKARSEEIGLRKLAAATRIEVLQRQIEPHFLFNTLATVKGLRATDPERSDQLLGQLVAYMEASSGARSEGLSTLGEEVALVRAYLEIFVIRMNGRLGIESKVSDDLKGMAFPSLVLATLAENAIKHGIFPQNGGTIIVSARRTGEAAEVTLADTGVGFGEQSTGSGIGLSNIAERLRLLYGDHARLQLGTNHGRGVRATITLPIGPAMVASS